MPNKVALRRTDTNELLALMAYAVDDAILAVEIIYVEVLITATQIFFMK